jgi:hypothetical protein
MKKIILALCMLFFTAMSVYADNSWLPLRLPDGSIVKPEIIKSGGKDYDEAIFGF